MVSFESEKSRAKCQSYYDEDLKEQVSKASQDLRKSAVVLYAGRVWTAGNLKKYIKRKLGRLLEKNRISLRYEERLECWQLDDNSRA